jgi:hypothetical protein
MTNIVMKSMLFLSIAFLGLAFLAPNIPAKQFWSVVFYSSQTRSMLQTDQQFPSTGSLKKGIVVNSDTSVDVYFGPKALAGKENN